MNEQTNLEAMQSWVNSLGNKDLGHLLHFVMKERAKRKRANKKQLRSQATTNP
jgi:hypothetical protein